MRVFACEALTRNCSLMKIVAGFHVPISKVRVLSPGVGGRASTFVAISPVVDMVTLAATGWPAVPGGPTMVYVSKKLLRKKTDILKLLVYLARMVVAVEAASAVMLRPKASDAGSVM